MQQITELGFYLIPQPYLLQFSRASVLEEFSLFLWEPVREFEEWQKYVVFHKTKEKVFQDGGRGQRCLNRIGIK